MSVMEISHRSKEYEAVYDEAVALVRELLGIPSNYKTLMDFQIVEHLLPGGVPAGKDLY